MAFLLLLFLVLQSRLVFNPGVRIALPQVPMDLPGTARPTVVVAIDRTGQLYYESQAVRSLDDLRQHLRTRVQSSAEPLTLELLADESSTVQLFAPLLGLAHEVGVAEAFLVMRPRIEPIFEPPRQ